MTGRATNQYAVTFDLPALVTVHVEATSEEEAERVARDEFPRPDHGVSWNEGDAVVFGVRRD